jgi:hypothetical protein
VNSRPYTILARHRPIRAAFLINTEHFPPTSNRFQALLDAVVDWNNIHWGGRTNHVSFYSGEGLTPEEWQHLEIADPDCILAFAPLSDAFIRELDERLNPWSIEVEDATQAEPDRLGVSMEGIAMPPTVENVRRLQARNALNFGNKEKLLMFEFAEHCDPVIRRFIHRNFGTFYQSHEPKTGKIRRIAWLEQLLPEIPHHTFTISDVQSLAAAITEMSGRLRPRNFKASLPFVAPYQLASLFLESWPTSELHKTFQLLIGDTAEDFSEHWNGVLFKRNWMETHRHQLWIPTQLAGDATFRESLHDWLCRYSNSGGGGYRIELLSHGFAKDAAVDFCTFFQQHEYPLHVQIVPTDRVAQRRRRAEEKFGEIKEFFPWTSDDDVIRFPVSSRSETISLQKPDCIQAENRDGVWITDVQIEHVSKVHNTMSQQSWWHLPRRNSGGIVHNMFHAPARISRQGRFSVRVESREPHLSRRIKPELKLQIPSDAALVRSLIIDPRNWTFVSSDARSNLPRAEPAVAQCRVSTKGAYLAGLIELFGDFWTAKSFCERKFWRDLFNRLAGHGTGGDEKLRQALVKLLKNKVTISEEAQVQEAVALANEVLHMVRGRLKGHYVGFKDCFHERVRLEKQGLSETMAYSQGRTMVQHVGARPITDEEMRQGLDALLEMSVLRLGVESECPRCKVPTWYPIDDLRQNLICVGCGNKYALRSTELWSYALNSLAQMSVSQGVLGVLHALTAIASHAHSFFAFAPSLDLFREGTKEPWHELDVLCVADGEFVIGEVKEGFVQKSAFEELAEVAEALLPQRAVIFLPVENATKQKAELNGWLKETQARLNPKGIAAEIFTLPAY